MSRDPYETYDRLRELGPAVWVSVMKRYLVTSYEACQAVEAGQETYSAAVSGSGATIARALGTAPMLRKDDPERDDVRSRLGCQLTLGGDLPEIEVDVPEAQV